MIFAQWQTLLNDALVRTGPNLLVNVFLNVGVGLTGTTVGMATSETKRWGRAGSCHNPKRNPHLSGGTSSFASPRALPFTCRKLTENEGSYKHGLEITRFLSDHTVVPSNPPHCLGAKGHSLAQISTPLLLVAVHLAQSHQPEAVTLPGGL